MKKISRKEVLREVCQKKYKKRIKKAWPKWWEKLTIKEMAIRGRKVGFSDADMVLTFYQLDRKELMSFFAKASRQSMNVWHATINELIRA
jgi:hypothetical protein